MESTHGPGNGATDGEETEESCKDSIQGVTRNATQSCNVKMGMEQGIRNQQTRGLKIWEILKNGIASLTGRKQAIGQYKGASSVQ